MTASSSRCRRARSASWRSSRSTSGRFSGSTSPARLWIDSTEEHANASLRTALWRVQHLRPAAGQPTSTHLALADDVPVDTCRDRGAGPVRARAAGASTPRASRASRRARVLLPDWYDDWVVIERERLRQLCLHALEQSASASPPQGATRRRRGRARRRRARAPARERSPRRDRGVSRRGQRSEATRQYRSFRELLKAELGLAPSPQLEELVAPLPVW